MDRETRKAEAKADLDRYIASVQRAASVHEWGSPGSEWGAFTEDLLIERARRHYDEKIAQIEEGTPPRPPHYDFGRSQTVIPEGWTLIRSLLDGTQVGVRWDVVTSEGPCDQCGTNAVLHRYGTVSGTALGSLPRGLCSWACYAACFGWDTDRWLPV